MATIIVSNIFQNLVIGGYREETNFQQSLINPLYYEFRRSFGTLNIGDIIHFTLDSINYQNIIIDNSGNDFTIDLPFDGSLPPSFITRVFYPPTAATANISVKTVAAFNPVVIQMLRADFYDTAYQSTWNNSYYSVICGYKFSNGNVFITPGFTLNAIIQVIDPELASEPDFLIAENFNIINIDIPFFNGYIFATFNKPYSSSSPISDVIINFYSRLNFYTTLRIKSDDTTPIYRDLRFTPNSNGIMRAEISGALRSLMNLNFTENESDPTIIRTDETNLTTGFYFATKDNWVGSNNSFVTYYNPTDIKYAIAGAFQIGDPFNGYYTKYFSNRFASIYYPDIMPRLLTQFEQPSYFIGFPYTISFLGNNYIDPPENFAIKYKITKVDGSIYENELIDFINYDFQSLVRFNMFEVLEAAYTADEMNNAKTIEFRFGTFNEGFFNDCVLPIKVNVKRPLEQSCNTFYVRWLNTLGGWDYFLFEGKIYEGFKVENGNNYETYFDTISSISDFENVTFKNVSPAVQVGSTTLTKYEAEGLKILPTSPKVYWYNEEISKWIGVIVEPGTFQLRSTKDDYFNVEFTFIKPKYFNQFA